MELAHLGSGLTLSAEIFYLLHPFVLPYIHAGHFLEGHQCLGTKCAVLNITRSVSPAASILVGSTAIANPLIRGN